MSIRWFQAVEPFVQGYQVRRSGRSVHLGALGHGGRAGHTT